MKAGEAYLLGLVEGHLKKEMEQIRHMQKLLDSIKERKDER